jgi:hypothetical protein
MIRHRCPNCELVIDSSAELAGLEVLCPHCRSARVEVPATSQVADAKHRQEERQAAYDNGTPTRAAAGEAAPAARGRCFVCDREDEVRPWYVRVNKRNVAASSYNDRWVHLRGPVCAGCVTGLRGLTRFRLIVGLLVFLVFPVLFCGGIPFLLMEVFGAPRGLVVGVFLTLTFLTAALMIGGPIWLHFQLKRRILKMLHPETATMLRSLPVGWNAGLTSELIVSAKAPPAGTAVVDVGERAAVRAW